MKKVGLLSMQSVNNYGSYWQARSLKDMLEEIGCSVSFIDIVPGKQIVNSTYKKSFSLNKIKRIPYYLYSKKRSAMYKRYKKEAFNHNIDNKYDAVVIGSDEVFNCKQESPWGFTTQLYGDINCRNVISYAASFGYTDYGFIHENGLENEIKKALLNLSSISVRDNNSYAIIKQLIDQDAYIHLDPVLLNMNLKDYAIPVKIKKKYILIYSYDFRLSEKEYISEIKKYAVNNGLLLVAAGFYQDWVDINLVATPYEILGLFKNAEYVITDTFHGTIFSVKFHRRFATIVRSSNYQKLSYLLEEIDLQSHIAQSGEQIIDKINLDVDYRVVDDLLLEKRNDAIKYLEQAIYD